MQKWKRLTDFFSAYYSLLSPFLLFMLWPNKVTPAINPINDSLKLLKKSK